MRGAAALGSFEQAHGSRDFEHAILAVATPQGWLDAACANIDVLLVDHANCEKKAASTALSLMFAYAEDLYLTDKMSKLAREELRHYEQVAKLLRVSKISPIRLSPGRYADGLRRLVAKTEPSRQIDLMICGAFIEARSCERFAATAPVIGGAAGELFRGLHGAEARHYEGYLGLARRAAARAGIEIGDRVRAFAALEAELIDSKDDVFRFHSGRP